MSASTEHDSLDMESTGWQGWSRRFGGLREDIARQHQRWRDHADPDCSLCHGRGMTHGYIGPGKTADYPCPCTGLRECE